MKVRLEEDYRRVYTLEELAQAKEVIKAMREDTTKPEEYGAMAIRSILNMMGNNDCMMKVLTAEAKTAKNSNGEYDRMGTNTGKIDVWITAYAETVDGFIRIGAYLTDIWEETMNGANTYIKYAKA